MPVTPEYHWSETRTHINVVAIIRSMGKSSKPDIMVCDCFLKINAFPSLLALDLYGKVKIGSAQVVVSNGNEISVYMQKENPGNWGSLTFQHEDTEVVRTRRADSIAAYEVLMQATAKKAKVQKDNERSLALESEWKQNDTHKDLVRSMKADAAKDAQETLEEWQNVVNKSKDVNSSFQNQEELAAAELELSALLKQGRIAAHKKPDDPAHRSP